MRKLILSSALVLLCSFFLINDSHADCILLAPIGTGNNIQCDPPPQNTPVNTGTPPANTTTMDDTVTVVENGGVNVGVANVIAIDTDDGNDNVTVNGEVISQIRQAIFTGEDDDTITVGTGADIMGVQGIDAGDGMNMITINDGSVAASGPGAAAIAAGVDADTVLINNGSLSSTGTFIVGTSGGDDSVTINNGLFSTGEINTGFGMDNIILAGGTFSQNEIDGSFDDDSIEVSEDIPNLGLLNCADGTDTLTLSMDVPEAVLAQLAANFQAAGDTGSIDVNGITYSWSSCEMRVANFNGVTTTIELAPLSATNIVFEDHTVTATVLTDGAPDAGVSVRTEIIFGPNAGEGEIALTDTNGQVSFTYTSDITGTDTIISSIDDPNLGNIESNTVTKTWILPPRNVPTLSEWGLIAMAAILGIIGFIVIRSRKAAA